MPAEASPLKVKIQDEIKVAMRAKEKERLATLRQITAAIKQLEVDNRQDLSDDDVIVVLTKMTKQRKDSLAQFEQAGREDLAVVERSELAIIEEFLPTPLTEAELEAAIASAIAESGASSIKDMGAVMNVLRPQVQGRADMGAVSSQVKAVLSA
ncbi:GatB/YqeY domain-containing protein [Methylophaga sp. OBS3]|uniref:GatB/YqeY domain-containing protein n=1 Tax=Methylophaga sp. OBS3 TaxID=2991934 RepID=UPI00224E9BBE|nr:GatB/YqeY domain-containing protein [Methylophaga sp. OBS3]MCX4189713.1 GatB/YqeY domain-containing protein [Methylophaga sp. OBS3]